MRTSLLVAVAVSALCSCRSQQTVEPDANRKSRSFDFVYKASVDEVPAGAKDVKLWMPVPVTTLDQKIADVQVESDAPYTIRPIQNGTGNALCATSAGKPIHVTLSFHATRYETHGGGDASKQELAADRKPNKMIPLDGKVAAVSASLKTSDDSMTAAHQLYQHVLDHMRYEKPEGQPWGRGRKRPSRSDRRRAQGCRASK